MCYNISMKLTEEQIKKALQKDIRTKTILVDVLSINEVIKKHEEEGWKVVSKVELNGRIKVTFQMVI